MKTCAMHPFFDIGEVSHLSSHYLSLSSSKNITQTYGKSIFCTQVMEADLIPVIHSNYSHLDKYHFVVDA